MFQSLAIHGAQGSLLWGYRAVAQLTSWRITQAAGAWRLSATFGRADAWQCGQAVKYQELVFTALRDKGQWCFPLTDVTVGTTELRATLGPPLS